VVGLWSPRQGISLEGLRAAVAGTHPDFDRVLVAVDALGGLADQLAVTIGQGTEAASAASVLRAVRDDPRALGLVPAGAVRPTVRALALDGARLFGSDRVTSLDAWPLTIAVDLAGGADPFDPATTWTLVAGGDVMLDREVHRQAVTLGKGPRYPWRGGIARIVRRRCCTEYGEPWIEARPVRDRGAVCRLLKAADVALVNHEGPAPERHRYHRSGFTFTFDPGLERGLRRAGIDIVSLANNHVRDAGARGVIETIRNVSKAGMRTVGAGRDLDAARRGTCLDVRDTRACFLAYDDVEVASNAATSRRPGAAILLRGDVRADVRRLREEGADSVIVVPHWGREYRDRATARQRRMAAVMAQAGADIVLGAHSHVIGALGDVGGTPVLYSMGDLLFDLTRFERTVEGILVEVTFAGGRAAQIGLHPTVLVNRSQVHLLSPRDGRVVIDRMRRASAGSRP
jgi:poly-gamma-glutamate synthesis protein (capsule biosynthesis protein)